MELSGELSGEDSYVHLSEDKEGHNSETDPNELGEEHHSPCHDEGCDDQSCPRHNEASNKHNNLCQNEIDWCYKRIHDLTYTDIMNMDFGSELEAYKFYKTYAKCRGFVVRKHNRGLDLRHQTIWRIYVCNRQGVRNKKHYIRDQRTREPRAETRTKCGAMLRVHLNHMTSRWGVTRFEEEHNHELTPAQFVHLIPAYRSLSEADKAQADSMSACGIRTCHIMGFMTEQAGGYAEVGFCKKDLYNHLDKKKRAKIKDGDAFAALSYLQAKANSDPMFFSKYTTTEDGILQHLFWSDGMSRVDYECFGDVLAFDTTYKKNKYNKPFLIFSGSNHHGMTTIFGCALLANETFETYQWVLEAFLEAMGNKYPKAVVTDGDVAMRKAINNKFPSTFHRLCGWHLQNNAGKNVKNANFLKEFTRCIYSNFDPDEFKKCWKKLIRKYGVSENAWVKKTYKRKRMWATAYLREHFFAGIRTTSRCEGINSFIKTIVKSKHSLIDLMHDFERAIRHYRNNESIADFKSSYSKPVTITRFQNIEEAAADIYTRDKFREFRDELEDAAILFVVDCQRISNTSVYKINRFGKPGRDYQILYDHREHKFQCSCRSFESRGIPCCHIVCVMKHEHINTFPSSLILKRWTKDAKSQFESTSPEVSDSKKMAMLRYGALSSACHRLSYLASKNYEDFSRVRDEICRMTKQLENDQNSNCVKRNGQKNVVGDPIMVKTKGAPSKRKNGKNRRRCSNCNTRGHSIRSCPKLVGDESIHDAFDDSSNPEVNIDKENCVEIDINSRPTNHGKETIKNYSQRKRPNRKSDLLREKHDGMKKRKTHSSQALANEGTEKDTGMKKMKTRSSQASANEETAILVSQEGCSNDHLQVNLSQRNHCQVPNHVINTTQSFQELLRSVSMQPNLNGYSQCWLPHPLFVDGSHLQKAECITAECPKMGQRTGASYFCAISPCPQPPQMPMLNNGSGFGASLSLPNPRGY